MIVITTMEWTFMIIIITMNHTIDSFLVLLNYNSTFAQTRNATEMVLQAKCRPTNWWQSAVTAAQNSSSVGEGSW